jgi:hypothetical protein
VRFQVAVFCGPVGWGWGGNFVALPCGSYDMEIRIGDPNGDATRIFCRVWIEGDELKAAKTRYYGATATRSESGPRLNSGHD